MNHLQVAHTFWKSHLKPGDIVIDATCGNGYDSAALASMILPQGELHCIDIQSQALNSTSVRLREKLLPDHFKKVSLHHQCHSVLPHVTPRLIVYNLGYLPRSDKTVTTKRSTTLTSLRRGLELIPEGAALSITCYPGHAEGKHETDEVLEWTESLSSQWYKVSSYRYLNRPKSPLFMWVLKL